MSTTRLIPLDTNQDTEKVREAAIAFYDKEHFLNSEERKQLYIFFEQQCRRMLLGFSFGVALGAATPFVVRKKGSLVHPAFPIIGAVIGGTIVPGLVNNGIYNLQLQQFNDKFGSESLIFKTIKATPDPITKSVYWSNYFKKSSGNPNFRMKDPRTVVNSTKFFSIEDNPPIPPYGKPGYHKSDDPNGLQTMSQQYLSGWDKVRYKSHLQTQSQSEQKLQPESQPESHLITIDHQPRSIGDSYDSRFTPSTPVSDADPNSPFHTNTDHLIQSQGSSGSSWEKIRRDSKSS